MRSLLVDCCFKSESDNKWNTTRAGTKTCFWLMFMCLKWQRLTTLTCICENFFHKCFYIPLLKGTMSSHFPENSHAQARFDASQIRDSVAAKETWNLQNRADVSVQTARVRFSTTANISHRYAHCSFSSQTSARSSGDEHKIENLALREKELMCSQLLFRVFVLIFYVWNPCLTEYLLVFCVSGEEL